MAPRTLSHHPKPDVSGGIAYWQSVEANVNGVLGGYGLGTLPRVDALGSRLFLLSLLPRLSTIPDVTQDPKVWSEKRKDSRRTRALDAGAGVGRVTRDVLGLLLDEVHLVEPVRKFLASAAAEAPTWPSLQPPDPSSSSSSSTATTSKPKSVHFHISTLHALNPARPWSTSDGGIFLAGNPSQEGSSGVGTGGRNKRVKTEIKDRNLGEKKGKEEGLIPPVFAPIIPPSKTTVNGETDTPTSPPALTSRPQQEQQEEEPLKYDVIWCQWMLQHLSDQDLISFLQRARSALIKYEDQGEEAKGGESQDGIIVVKENVCSELEDGSENVWWDEEDKSITRSSNAYQRVFREAGLEVVRCEVQKGLPEELFVVKMWALR